MDSLLSIIGLRESSGYISWAKSTPTRLRKEEHKYRPVCAKKLSLLSAYSINSCCLLHAKLESINQETQLLNPGLVSSIVV